jgi:hypothetical protein
LYCLGGSKGTEGRKMGCMAFFHISWCAKEKILQGQSPQASRKIRRRLQARQASVDQWNAVFASGTRYGGQDWLVGIRSPLFPSGAAARIARWPSERKIEGVARYLSSSRRKGVCSVQPHRATSWSLSSRDFCCCSSRWHWSVVPMSTCKMCLPGGSAGPA